MRLLEATDTRHRETDQCDVQMGCRRNTPISTRDLPSRVNTDPIRATPTRDTQCHTACDTQCHTTPRQHSLSLTRLTEWEVFGSSERFSYDSKRVQGKDQTRLSGSFSVGEGDLRTRAVQPTLAQPGTSDSLSLSLTRSCAIALLSLRIPGHLERKKRSAGR